MSCEDCYKGAGGKPACGACLKPILDEENIGVWQAWTLLQGSPHIAGMGTYMGADMLLSEQVFEYMEVPWHERLFWFSRMMLLNQIAIKHKNKRD